MGKVIWLVSPDIAESARPSESSTTEAKPEKHFRKGWNNRGCEGCGRPYTRPPPWSSFPDVEKHPDWPEWILTSYCNKGLCNGVQPSGECKPRLVKIKPKK